MAEQDEPIEIHLVYPIQYTDSLSEQTETVERLTLPPRLKAKHSKLVDENQSQVNQALALIAGATGLPMKAVEELDLETDFARVMEAMSGPLPSSLQGGDSSSE